MSIKSLLAIIALTIAACNNESTRKETVKKEVSAVTKETDVATNSPVTAETKQDNKRQKPDDYWERLVMRGFYDNKGTLTVAMPFPSSWQIKTSSGNGQPSITGPNGIKITDYPLQSFMYTNDPRLQQVYYQSGQKLRMLPNIEQLIQQDFIPWGNRQGLQFVKYYEVPEISKIDKWYSDQLYKAMPSQTKILAIGTDWKSNDGTPYFLLIHLNASATSNMQNWYYMCTSLEAENGSFDMAKKQFVFALSNTRYNLEPIMIYNQQEAQRVGKSWAEHNKRMAQNQAAFEASQRAHVNKSNAINDAIMNGWRKRNKASDITQEKFIDVITEHENVQDPTNQQLYKVLSGSNQYWMNRNGEYIGTQMHDYNPNLDENMNQQKWQQLKKVN